MLVIGLSFHAFKGGMLLSNVFLCDNLSNILHMNEYCVTVTDVVVDLSVLVSKTQNSTLRMITQTMSKKKEVK